MITIQIFPQSFTKCPIVIARPGISKKEKEDFSFNKRDLAALESIPIE
jgi:hypothetical protein